MTIRTRNRITLGLFIISGLIFILCGLLLGYLMWSKKLNFEYFSIYEKSSFFLIKYNPYIVISSIFFLMFYVFSVSYIIFRSFEITNAIEADYLIIFLLACLASCSRLIVGLMNLTDTYSHLLIACGNIMLFSRILFPLALIAVTTMPVIEQRQDTERNLCLVILLSIFFAKIIPLNTITTRSNFSVDYSFKIMLDILTTASFIISSVVLYISNKRRLFSQKITLGFILTALGVILNFHTVNLLQFIIGIILLSLGTYFYFYELHKQYLWND